MARIVLPPKSNVYTLMLVVTAIILLIGFVLNSSKLSEYKNTKAKLLRDVKIPEVVVEAAPAEAGDAAVDDLDDDLD
jgi:hypothetical protein